MKEYLNIVIVFFLSTSFVHAQKKHKQAEEFVIKQIYYAGSGSETAAGISDQFIEIFNNSYKTIYADGLCVSFVTGSRIMPGAQLSERAAHSLKDFAIHKDGAFDWTQSYGMPDSIRANEDYVYASNIYKIPGKGKDYPVKPGESFIIAQSAVNYQKPFKTFSGREQTPTHPDSTIDLSHADFEVNMTGLEGSSRDTDNPGVTDIDIVRRDVKLDMMPDWNGKEAVIIYRYPGDIEKIPSYTYPLKGKVKTTNAAHLKYPFYQVPISCIIDAVEIQPGNGIKAPKRLMPSLDKGFCGAGVTAHSSKSVIRKTLKKKGDRIILQDTNNSSDDFVAIKAAPKAFEK